MIRWTEQMLIEEALKYNNRSDFSKGSGGAYKKACSMKILDKITTHMSRQGDIYNRFIYTIEFENNSIYIGLTYNLEKRISKHIKNSSNKYVNNYMFNSIKYIVNSDNILYKVEDAIRLECDLIDKYKNEGYKVLNISKGGGLGGSKKWSDEMLRDEALKYKTRLSFQKLSSGAYQSSKSRGILNEICKHMSDRFIWTQENIKQEALKYKTRSDFSKGSVSAYCSSIKMCILDEVCSHMDKIKITWSDEMLKEEALKYNTRTTFNKNSKSAYQTAYSRGILDDICSHMTKLRK
jgi:predicted GIY-YIG superfamily endonuclease